MDGIATLTIVTSSRSISAAIIITTAAAQRRGYGPASVGGDMARVVVMASPVGPDFVESRFISFGRTKDLHRSMGDRKYLVRPNEIFATLTP
ncbi:hypothetical protein [Streptomyces longisporus]|uniref:hypothetical protein n=1 Tax=Streptomyces longisporus TaxID=1948 RepID=UPI0031D524E6